MLLFKPVTLFLIGLISSAAAIQLVGREIGDTPDGLVITDYKVVQDPLHNSTGILV
jgi:hypothetical protein